MTDISYWKLILRFRRKCAIAYLFLLTVLATVNSCNKENSPDCIQTAGEFVTVKRVLEEFDLVELRDYVQIELYDSTAYFVEITAPKNLIPEIETNVNEGLLKIENKNSCNFVRSFKKRIKVRIYAPQFRNIQNYGTGDLKCINAIVAPVFKIENRNAAGTIALNLHADTVSIATHTGVCDVLAVGQSNITNLFNQGLGIIDARALITTDAFVNNSSINNVYVNVNGYFFALIEFSGNIFYSGTPNYIDKSIRGNGRLIEID